ncbi:PAS domain-containing protein [Hymenobacter persicinus]|uniref:histidine kinase n=1 Tax=Hymenobacter persicinus TaxID=2025506 RepID=A0A4V1ZB14_9BACT|nr:PAS domain-containing protein [Hymenobacter persicinus]RYU81872.1 PAS domain S-box protein [Hymenobacter persicinus]
MPDSFVPAGLPADLSALVLPEELLAGMLEVSLTAVALYEPVFGPAGNDTIVDFRIVLLNPVARRILQLPAQPPELYLHYFPGTLSTGVFDFHCRVFHTGQPERLSLNYQADGLDNYFRLSACRVGRLVLVSFTDTADETRSGVEQALRESQARERAARAEAERQRTRLHDTFMQAPAMICIFDGPEHVFELVNPPYQQLVGNRPLLGRPIREAMPELAGQPIFELLDAVYRTGQPFHATEMLVQLDHDNEGRQELEKRYYNFIYQPRRGTDGQPDGIMVFAYDVSPQVQARQLIEDKERELRVLYTQSDDINEELAAANEELHAANEEALANNEELYRTEQLLRELNLKLESRVADRTAQLRNAQAEAERHRARLYRFFMQAPAAICIFDGPDLVFELVNAAFQQMFAARQLLGRPLLEVLPEILGHPAYTTLRQVFDTGSTHEESSRLVPIRNPKTGQLEDRYFNYIQQARFDEQGRIDGVMVFALEVTEQTLARQQASAQQEQLRALFEQAPVAIAVFYGPGHVVELANPAICAIWGRSPAQVLGLPLVEALPEVEEQGFVALLDGVYQTGIPYVAQEHPTTLARHGQQEDIFLNFVYHPMRDEQGQITGITVVAIDVTEHVAARQLLGIANDELTVSNTALDLLNQQLTRTNQDLDNFVYTASHDLKQPVDNMAGLFDELKHSATFHDPQATLMIGMFEEALRQIDGTIQGLTAVVQTERLSGQIPTETVELLPLTQSVLQSLHHQATGLHAGFELDFTAVPAVHFARLNLQSILYNLLSNALKYAHPDRPPRVRISTALSAEGAPVLSVRDNGLGLDVARYGADLFQMFRRFHDHTAGSGMGLYLVNRILRQAGGHIEVESTVGEGSTFHIHLPPSARQA